ncbi:VOC family protein [Flavobacterium sp. RSSA_27]|uniref:VOC family protein n=1 Tax=Flavobacterium sp. RSSA_27 TaxID=3447667 RepID=UPI003F3C7A22
MITTNAVTWFEIYVDSMERAQRFYETVLGYEMIPMPMPDEKFGQMVAFPWVEGAPNSSGALVKHEMGKPSATGTLVYFACSDCAEQLARVEGAGGKVIAPKFAIGEHGFCGLASDTEGNTIGFHSIR